jgi:hypothetical protein
MAVGTLLPLAAFVALGSRRYTPPRFNSPILNATWGDVIRIRVRDKDGAYVDREHTLIEP